MTDVPIGWETPRLAARRAARDAAQEVFAAYAQDPHVARYMIWRPWRRGLMTEAVRFVVDWALSQPGVYSVWATCDVENVASARLLESVGMQHEGVLRRWIVHPNMSDKPRDALCYALVK